MTSSLRFPFACALFSLSSWAAAQDAAPPVTPYRPSVSSPAQLPAAGQLELELGGLRTKAGDARRDSLPWLAKLAFSPEWGVLLGGEARVVSREAGVRDSGTGDTLLVLKRAWVADDTHAGGIELGVKLPTANDAIGSGKVDYTLNFIESIDFGSVHNDLNLNLTRLGVAEEGSSRTQLGLSASFSVPLAEQWGATAELSGTHRSGVPNTAQVLVALGYSPSKRLSFDFGLARGLRPTPHGTSFFGGVVFPVAQLW